MNALLGGEAVVGGRHEGEALGTVPEVSRVAATATSIGSGALGVDHALTL